VTMKKRDSGIIRRKADFHFLVSADPSRHPSLSRKRFPGNPGELEGVTMKMDGMNIVAGVCAYGCDSAGPGGDDRPAVIVLAGKHLVV